MQLFSKLKWVASILLVFFIVLITNLIDRQNFNRLSYSVTTLYEDRIVASDLLFSMSGIVKEKQVAVLTNDTVFFASQNEKHNRTLSELIDQYRLTKLTDKEQLLFEQLQDELATLEQQEKSTAPNASNEMLSTIKNIDDHLHDLSKIQVQEGRRQLFISNKAKDNINLFTQGEIIFLIVMAILVQVIILYKPKEEM